MDKLSRYRIAMVTIVGKKNQAWAARQLRVDGPKMSLMLSGERSLDSVDDEAERAFISEFPLLDALLPSGWEKDVSIETNVAGAMMVLRMAKAALAGAASDRDRWVFHRLAAKAELQAGTSYEFDEDTGNHLLEVSSRRLDAAAEHFRALRDLRCIPARQQDVVCYSVKQNLLALDMLREKAAGAIKPTSAALRGFRELLEELALVYQQKQADFARWVDDGQDDNSSDPDKIGISTPEQVLRLLITFTAAAAGELSLEIGDRRGALDALTKASAALGSEYQKLLKIVFLEMAWTHNRPAYLELFGSKPIAVPQNVPATSSASA